MTANASVEADTSADQAMVDVLCAETDMQYQDQNNTNSNNNRDSFDSTEDIQMEIDQTDPFDLSGDTTLGADLSGGTITIDPDDQQDNGQGEAEEWKSVLSFFCGQNSLTAEQTEAGMNLVRKDSSFCLKSLSNPPSRASLV